ncbi:MAG: hypothetical protein KQJ78_10490 [Deltaproteobacteria bacterium]|nr:hypothetical protein [Deltaproteobacteria bacterium]
MLTAALAWLLVLEALGLVGWPLAWAVFRPLAGRAYPLAKVLGVFLAGYLFWLGASLGLWPNRAPGAWAAVVLAALLAGGLGLAARRRGDGPGPGAWLWRRRAQVLAWEAGFVLAYALWLWLRAHAPAVSHTEQPMDLMLLWSLWESPGLPPGDAWLAGHGVGYYYLGHLLLSLPGRLAGVGPELGYNLGQAGWWALLTTGAGGLAAELTALAGRGRAARAGAAGLGALFLGMMANPAGVWDAMGQWVTPRAWWWWSATRVLGDQGPDGRAREMISEFPFFSYFLGDNHAHVLAAPLGLLLLGLLLARLARAWAASPLPAGAGFRRALAGLAGPAWSGPAAWALAGLTAGAFAAANAWAWPGWWLVAGLSLAAGAWRLAGVRGLAPAAALLALLLAGSLLAFLPYFRHAASQELLPALNLDFGQSLPRWLAHTGFLLAWTGMLCRLAWRGAPPSLRVWAGGVGLFVVLPAAGLALAGFWAGQAGAGGVWAGWARPGVLVVSGLGLALAAALLWPRLAPGEREEPGAAWLVAALIWAGAGLLLLWLPEMVYLSDMFANRMNTVFKFYYQAWLLLAVAGAAGMAVSLARPATRPLALGVLAFSALGLAYPLTAAWELVRQPPPGGLSLSTDAALAQTAPDELAAVRWLRTHASPGAVVAQAPGASYQEADNRPSTRTGLPALLGWEGHEHQWRGHGLGPELAARRRDLAAIYQAPNPARLREVLRRRGVAYVYLGPRERQTYHLAPGEDGLVGRVLTPCFTSGAVRLYAAPGAKCGGRP